VAPLSAYGRTKADAEIGVLASCGAALIARTGAFFGPWDEARKAASGMGYPEELIEDCLTDDLSLAASRPSYRVLGTERGQRLPALDDALARFVTEREHQRRQPPRGSAA
jgi:dTDP-4-dehydrorhamnose reductase